MLAFCLLATSSIAVSSTDAFNGKPPVQQFSHDLDVHPQNFSLAQTSDGLLYVGSNDGLLVYDGERWHHEPLPNGQLARSLLAEDDGQVFVGGYDLFGVARRDETGAIVFTDLSSDLPESVDAAGFADIWSITATEQAIWFKAVRDLFRVDRANLSVSHFHHSGRFGAAISSDNVLYVQFRGDGLKRYRNGSFESVSTDPLWHEQIYQLVPLADGRWLGNARDGTWIVFDGERTGIFDEITLPSGDQFFDIAPLANGDIAMAGKDGAVHLLQVAPMQYRRVKLSSDTLFGVRPARTGGVLALTDLGVLHMQWPTAWTTIDADHGLQGNVHALGRWAGQWLALTESGVMAWHAEKEQFENLQWTAHEAWALWPLDSEFALLADSYGLKLISGEGQRDISHGALYPRGFLASRHRPDRLFVATELGLAIADMTAPKDSLLLHEWSEPVTRVNSLFESEPGILWLGTDTRGVVRIRLDDAYTQIIEAHYFGEGQGVEYGINHQARVSHDGQTLIASTHAGLFRLVQDRFEHITDGLARALDPIQVVTIAEADPQDRRWAYTHNRLYRQDANGTWHALPSTGLKRGALRSHALDGPLTLFGANASILIHDAHTASPTALEGHDVTLTRVLLREEATEQRLNLDRQSLSLASGDFSISFRYALPSLGPTESTRYRARLLGYEEQFGNWGRATQITYSNLRPGRYQFEVVARDHNGRISQTAPFEFQVETLWYNTTSARILWLALGIIALMGATRWIVRRRTRLLAAESKRLASMVDERTRELATANRQLESMAHIDGLTGIANRRRLDSYLQECADSCQQRRRPLSVLLMDVDLFKQFNDQYGHLAGDHLLRRIATESAVCLRRHEDLLARYGGEEFMAVLPGADHKKAVEVAEEIRRQIEKSKMDTTVSIGVATSVKGDAISVADVIQAADEALYRAKAQGRNRVLGQE